MLFRSKNHSPNKTTLTLTKQFILPSVKIPADKYYDYKVSQLKNKPDKTLCKNTQVYNKGDDDLNERDLTFIFTQSDKIQEMNSNHYRTYRRESNKTGNPFYISKRHLNSENQFLHGNKTFMSFEITKKTHHTSSQPRKLQLKDHKQTSYSKFDVPNTKQTVPNIEVINKKLETLQISLKKFGHSIKEIKSNDLLHSDRNKHPAKESYIRNKVKDKEDMKKATLNKTDNEKSSKVYKRRIIKKTYGAQNNNISGVATKGRNVKILTMMNDDKVPADIIVFPSPNNGVNGSSFNNKSS